MEYVILIANDVISEILWLILYYNQRILSVFTDSILFSIINDISLQSLRLKGTNQIIVLVAVRISNWHSKSSLLTKLSDPSQCAENRIDIDGEFHAARSHKHVPNYCPFAVPRALTRLKIHMSPMRHVHVAIMLAHLATHTPPHSRHLTKQIPFYSCIMVYCVRMSDISTDHLGDAWWRTMNWRASRRWPVTDYYYIRALRVVTFATIIFTDLNTQHTRMTFVFVQKLCPPNIWHAAMPKYYDDQW